MFKTCQRCCLWPQLELGVLLGTSYVPGPPNFGRGLRSAGRVAQSPFGTDPLQAEESLGRGQGNKGPRDPFLSPPKESWRPSRPPPTPMRAFLAHATCFLKQAGPGALGSVGGFPHSQGDTECVFPTGSSILFGTRLISQLATTFPCREICK